MELKHFSHGHPLILTEKLELPGGDVYCVGCNQPIWGPSYGCISCNFFLHKPCAELPEQVTHPKHPKHPLFLYPPPPYGYTWSCASCGTSSNKFYYKCSSSCYFQLDITCFLMMENIQQRIQHKCHEHPLTSLHRPALFLCSACGLEHVDASFLCSICGFWVNQRCASLPSTVKCLHHPHPLTLAYSLPDEYYIFLRNCDICHENVNDPHWVYYCAGCRFFSHVYCVESAVKFSRDGQTEIALEELYPTSNKIEELDPNVISLPLDDDSLDAITLFFKGMTLQGKCEKAAEIIHDSHDHPLIFIENEINSDSCNGCAQTISPPFYHCAECNFLLHERCAKLPKEVKHPCHPEHSLILILQPDTIYPSFRCINCTKCCNVFMYGCSVCNFYLDTRCASLPHSIKHEAHNHTLSLSGNPDEHCIGCRNSSGFLFACNSCNFNLCDRCALLPAKFTHISDEHALALTYSPVENHLYQFFCNICEYEVDPKCWFYHCVDCDQTLHTECVHPHNYDPYLNVKFGGTMKVDDHAHLLTFVRIPINVKNPPTPLCGRCGNPFDHDLAAFECFPCNHRLHYYCAYDSIANKS